MLNSEWQLLLLTWKECIVKTALSNFMNNPNPDIYDFFPAAFEMFAPVSAFTCSKRKSNFYLRKQNFELHVYTVARLELN